MVSAKNNGSISLWAWMASIIGHMVFLGALGAVHFTHSAPEEKQPNLVTARIEQVREPAYSPRVMPKPRVKPAESPSQSFAEELDADFGDIFAFDAGPDELTHKTAPAIVDTDCFGADEHMTTGCRVEFFGAETSQRKVCYLIDRSGSMRGVLPLIQRRLKQSVSQLEQDNYFYLIFFGGGRFDEFGDGELVRASDRARSEAVRFIDSVKASGKTNAPQAIARALEITDSVGNPPSVIYFLTDGFELAGADAQKFQRQISDLLRHLPPRTRINTIGLWPRKADQRILEKISSATGGEFRIVSNGTDWQL